ncbi:MAG: cysteine peptidase family C39 domain-containing protein [Planctomycetota bacterium]
MAKNMEYIYFTLLILLSLAGFYAGWRYVGPSKSRWAMVAAIISEAVILLYVVFRYYPEWEYRLIPLFIYPFTEVVSFIPFAMLFFGFTIRRTKTRWLPMELAIIAGLVFVYGLYRVEWIYPGQNIKQSAFRVTKDGVCMQSTGYTCGAASAVTLLKWWGIEATEVEMAYLSHTRKRLGVEMVQLTRAVAYKASAKRLTTDIREMSWKTLKRLGVPCIVNVKWTPPFINHMVVVMSASEEKVVIADPLCGTKNWSKQEFLDNWRGTGIYIISGK